MAGQLFDSYSFFDGLEMEPVTQVNWSNYWRGVIPDGVVAEIEDEMRPYANSTGMYVYVSKGACIVDNHRGVNSALKMMAVNTADATYPRIDLLVARVVERLDIFGFLLLEHFGRDETELNLKHVHHQTRHTSVTVCPRMDRDETEVRHKRETIGCKDVIFRQSSAFRIEPVAEVRQGLWHLLMRQIRASAETGCDIDFAQLAFCCGERAKRRVVRATGVLHHNR